MNPRLSLFASGLIIASPLAANLHQPCCPLLEGYNAPYIEDNCASRFYAEIDYLLWYANQEGLSYATVADIASDLDTDVGAVKGIDRFLDNRWDSGVRAAIGYKPSCHSWDIRATYSFFETKVYPRADVGELDYQPDTIGNGVNIFVDYLDNGGTFGTSPVTIGIGNISRWKMNFNLLDLEVGREFYVAKDLTFRPIFGFRGLWVDQRFESNKTFDGIIFDSLLHATQEFDTKSEFGGFGVKAGFDAAYTIGWGLDFYGTFSGSVLWGRFKVKEAIGLFNTLDDITTEFYSEDFIHSHHASILNVDVGAGIRWNYWLNCGQNLLTLKFGWEQHIYTKMNQLQNTLPISNDSLDIFDRNVSRGNLSLSGFVFGLSFTY